VISTQYKGKIPDTQSELRELPGIGDYTSAAIIAFAFDERSLVLDINIRRVFARVIDGVEVPTAATTKRERQEREKLIPLNLLGDGIRRMLSIILGIAEVNDGVILIDEIDLHLDPTWQARVVQGLLSAFPHTQFVLTTHSEQVIGSVPADCVRRLVSGKGEILVENVRIAQGATSERILIELMGANERVPGEVTKLLSAYIELVDQDAGGGEEALALRQQLNTVLGDDERLRQADLEMEKRRILAEFTSFKS
jgi:predicted ATP-binding protein involved in virulence